MQTEGRAPAELCAIRSPPWLSHRWQERPDDLSYELVAEQLNALGTFQALRLMGLGFPVRVTYSDLRSRYLSRLQVRPRGMT
jgi:hypothetical protein